MDDSTRERLLRLAEHDGASFTELVEIAGLNPAAAFRGADLSGVDFETCDLAGFDFSDADLSGANFESASIAGAIFDNVTAAGTRWPDPARTRAAPRPRSRLRRSHEAAVKALLLGLKRKGRALALMPHGTGRQVVMEEVVARLVEQGRMETGMVFVESAAMRAQLLRRLRQRLPDIAVEDGSAPALGSKRPRVTVDVLRGYGAGLSRFRDRVGLGMSFDHVLLSSVSGAANLKKAFESLTAETRVGAVVTPPFRSDMPMARRERRVLERFFKEPDYLLSVEQALADGLLGQTEVIIPGRLGRFRGGASARKAGAGEEGKDSLAPLAWHLASLCSELRIASVVALCRGAAAADAFTGALIEVADKRPLPHRIIRYPGVGDELGNGGPVKDYPSIVVSKVSAGALRLCERAECVAVLTKLTSDNVHKIALRPAGAVREDESPPLVIDYGGSFRDLPAIRSEADLIAEFRGVSEAELLG